MIFFWHINFFNSISIGTYKSSYYDVFEFIQFYENPYNFLRIVYKIESINGLKKLNFFIPTNTY